MASQTPATSLLIYDLLMFGDAAAALLVPIKPQKSESGPAREKRQLSHFFFRISHMQ